MSILLLLTGGTIDKKYNPLNGSLGFAQTHLPEILKRSNCTANIETETIFLKDSLDTTEAERGTIVQRCVASTQTCIILTHGTDTMVATAKKIAEQMLDKTIVLTGAMIPYSIQNSDALFNVGAAITAVQLLNPGVYIVMNGKIFLHNKVKKDTDIGQFVTLK